MAEVVIHVNDGNLCGGSAAFQGGDFSSHGQSLLKELLALLELHVIDDIDNKESNRWLSAPALATLQRHQAIFFTTLSMNYEMPVGCDAASGFCLQRLPALA